jgi:hypothetical protein
MAGRSAAEVKAGTPAIQPLRAFAVSWDLATVFDHCD